IGGGVLLCVHCTTSLSIYLVLSRPPSQNASYLPLAGLQARFLQSHLDSMPSTSSPTKPNAPPVPSPSNPVLLATQAQWIFTDAELSRTPSLLDGMTMEAEHTSRSKGVNFITQVGILLKLPQLTLCTASVYLHRFFMRYSMVDLPHRHGMHPYSIAATALFLATKVEENCR